VQSLINKKVVAISCGETHTLALTDSGHLYSFGANGCGQLGQFLCEYEKRRRDSFEDIQIPRSPGNGGDQYSLNFSCIESERSGGNSPNGDDERPMQSREPNADQPAGTDVPMQGVSPLLSPPPLYSTDDYKIDNMQMTPKLVKSLMHRRVIKISSGGVHNICIVEPNCNRIAEEVYRQYIRGLCTDVVFRGFYQTYEEEAVHSAGFG
jgi:hypothetical protein